MTASSPYNFPGDKPTGKRRTFSVTVSKTVEMSLDESVIAQGVLPDGYILGPNPSDASASVNDEPWEVEIDREVSK